MQWTNPGMMGYCPTPKKVEVDTSFHFDLSVLIAVVASGVIACGFIAYDKCTGIFEYRRKERERYKLKNGLVPAWVFRDKDSMTQWLRVHLGYEPKPFHVDMIMALKEARIAAFQRKNVGKGYTLKEVEKKITEES